jgi:hypothetical protein
MLFTLIKVVIEQTTTCRTLMTTVATLGLKAKYRGCGSRWRSFEGWFILESM